MSSPSGAADDLLWQRLVDAERRYYAANMELYNARTALLNSDADVLVLVRRALSYPPEWAPALRLLLQLDESRRREMFPMLVELASTAHGNIQLARDVLLSLDRQWLLEHIPAEIERILRQSATYEEYRRFAELLDMVRSPYLATLVEKAAMSTDPDIREVADDYRDRTPP